MPFPQDIHLSRLTGHWFGGNLRTAKESNRVFDFGTTKYHFALYRVP
jgi:hypothetical protein